tara:strand:+ start:30 stop:350 length:321 start_codon:yes stop_codon:yes gene_type:complete
MSQDLTNSYKKLDALKQLECDTNIMYILEVLNKWNKTKDNDQLKKVIDAFLEIQFYLIELKRDKELAMKALIKYKRDRNTAVDEYQKLKHRLNEDRNFTGNSRGDK